MISFRLPWQNPNWMTQNSNYKQKNVWFWAHCQVSKNHKLFEMNSCAMVIFHHLQKPFNMFSEGGTAREYCTCFLPLFIPQAAEVDWSPSCLVVWAWLCHSFLSLCLFWTAFARRNSPATNLTYCFACRHRFGRVSQSAGLCMMFQPEKGPTDKAGLPHVEKGQLRWQDGEIS